jgi:HK97 family phage major capsid protein
MEEQIKAALDAHGKAIEEAMKKYDGQIAESGKADNEIRSEVKALSDKFEKSITELAQKMTSASPAAPEVFGTAGEQFVKSDAYRALVAGDRQMARIEVKNTVQSGSTTVFPFQKPGVIPGEFAPLTVRAVLRSIPVTSNAVNSLREASFTNSAAEVSQGGSKPESDVTFEQYNVPITTVAHFLKVTNQLLADAPAIISYIDLRARDGLAQRVDAQLLNGNGTPPNLSGLTDSGNFTAYTAVTDDILVDAINRAKYQLWADGFMPDVCIVNPADWGEMERTRESVGSGMYLYGAPGQEAANNPFGVRIVMSNHMTPGKFLVAALDTAAVLYSRSGAVVEMGYVNEDFTKNLVTIRVEERLGLGVERPSAILYGDFTA